MPKQPVLDLALLARSSRDVPSLLSLPFRALTQSGRSAILVGLSLLGVRPGARVLVPAYHCPTMIAPVETLGAVPLFYPVLSSGQPDMDFLTATRTEGVRAMIAAHFFGLPVDLSDAAGFCRELNIGLIEDCAHCFIGESVHGQVGMLGQYAVGSLPKFFPVLRGGILASASIPISARELSSTRLPDELRALWDIVDLAASANRLGQTGRALRRLKSARRGPHTSEVRIDGIVDPTPEEIRSTALADSLLRPSQLSHVETWVARHTDLRKMALRRRQNFRRIATSLADLASARPLCQDCPDSSAPYVVPLLVNELDRSYRIMREQQLPVFRWDRIWPSSAVQTHSGTHRWPRQLIQIACHQSLSEREVDYICGQIRTAFHVASA